MSVSRIAVYGAGGLGKEFRGMIEDLGLEFVGYVDDNKIIPKADLTKADDIVIAIACTADRRRIAEQFQSAVYPFHPLIHTSVPIHASVKLGKGSVICPGVRLTVDIVIGEFAIINLNATIGHDVRLGNFVSVMPGVNISGNVTVGDGAFIGSGATILQGLSVGSNSVIGAGAVVTKDVPPGITVVGVPARPMKK